MILAPHPKQRMRNVPRLVQRDALHIGQRSSAVAAAPWEALDSDGLSFCSTSLNTASNMSLHLRRNEPAQGWNERRFVPTRAWARKLTARRRHTAPKCYNPRAPHV